MSKTTDAFIEHENVVGRLIGLAEAAEDSNDSSTAFDIWRGIELIEDLQKYHDDIRAENSMLIDALANYEQDNVRLDTRVAELERAALTKKDGIRILLKDGESIGSFQEYLEAIAKAEGER